MANKVEKLAWGECKIKFAEYADTIQDTAYKEIGTVKENSTELSFTQGETKQAFAEGHKLVDSYTSKGSYTLKFTLFVTKSTEDPFKAIDGTVGKYYSFIIEPTKPDTPKVKILCASVSSSYSFRSADGIELNVEAVSIPVTEGKSSIEVVKPTGSE